MRPDKPLFANPGPQVVDNKGMSQFTAADATAISQARFASDVGYAVARKSLDHQKQQGAAAIALLDAAASIAQGPSHPDKGHRIDVSG